MRIQAWLVAFVCTLMAVPVAGAEPPRWVIAIHGGAGTIGKDMAPELVQGYRTGLHKALEVGKAVLEKGGTSVDACEAVVSVLEDDEHFNAGKGAVYTHEGTHELDAAIMDGKDLRCGAVAGLETVRNPIRLARLVMEKSPHVFLIGTGAEAFAAAQGLEPVDPTYFDTKRRYEQLQKALADDKFGTVGCVALDTHGNLAAATSSGGLTNKRFGRVGDVPIIGAGTYADNKSCAVSCTGKGEEFIRHTVARDIAARVEYQDKPLQAAMEAVIHQKLARGDGGAIAVSRKGEVALVFNSTGMYRGVADANGRFETAIWDD